MTGSSVEDIENILFYRVSDEYIKFLHDIDSRVQFNDPRGELRPYIGVVLNIGEHKLFAPLSDYLDKFRNPKRSLVKSNLSFAKVYEDVDKPPVSVIKFNCMIPFLESEFSYVDFNTFENRPKYQALLEAEYQYIKTHRSDIIGKATRFLDEISKGKGFFYEKSVDINLLMKEYKKFGTLKSV